MAIVKVRGTLKEARQRARVDIVRAERARDKRARADITRPERGLFSPKLKRPRVHDFGKRCGSLQSSEQEDHNYLLDRNLRSEKARDDRIRAERSRDDRFRAERSRPDRGKAQRARADSGWVERVRADNGWAQRARAYRSWAGRARADSGWAERARAYRGWAGRARVDRGWAWRTRADRGMEERARVERGWEERARADRGWAERARADRGWAGRARTDKGIAERAKAHVARVERARAHRAKASKVLFTPKLKRPKPRVDVFGNFLESHGSMQGNEREDYYRLDCDLVKSSNLQLDKISDEISQFSVQHVGIVKTTAGESFPSPSIMKENSVKSKEDHNTSRQGLMMRQPLPDHYHSTMTVTCESFDVSQQHVSCLEVKDLSEVKKDLGVLEDTSGKSRKQNWSKEHQHKTNIISSNVATTFDSQNSCSVLGRKSRPPSNHHQSNQTSMHAEFSTKISVEVEHTDRIRVKGALEAYKEILTKLLTKWRAKNCNIYVQAAMDLKKHGKWVNTMKQMGSIGGVRVGDKFRYRAQLNVIGLHKQFTDGIDRMRRNDGKVLAISIVDSGRYANNLQSSDILIYSGHGGKALFDKTKLTDQIMQGGNLALKNSQEEGTPIRVIRRLKHSNGSCYVYYGLYTVEEVMEERELSVMTYKFRLRRKSGQPKLSFDS